LRPVKNRGGGFVEHVSKIAYDQRRCFKLEMHHKRFGGRALLGAAGGAYSAPTDRTPLAGLRMRGPRERTQRMEREGKKKRGEKGKGKIAKKCGIYDKERKWAEIWGRKRGKKRQVGGT